MYLILNIYGYHLTQIVCEFWVKWRCQV